MAVIAKIKAVIEGFGGAPGVNTWYCQSYGGQMIVAADLKNFADQIESCYEDLKGFFPYGQSVQLEGVAAAFDVGTGDLTGVVPLGTRTTITSTAGPVHGTASRATQLNVRLQTDRIVGNRILAGRHFIGPINTTAMDQNGKIQPAVEEAVQNAYEGLLDIAGVVRLAVWSQPKPARIGSSGKPLPAQEGVAGFVQQVYVPEIPGTLRSRKV